MNGKGLLNADMQTLGRWLAQGWHWWIEELRGLVPDRLLRGRDEGLPRLLFDGRAMVPDPTCLDRKGWRLRRGTRVSIVLQSSLCLSRIAERPALNARDLHRMLQLEGDVLLPFPSGTTLVAGRAIGEQADGRMAIEVAGLPVEVGHEIVAVAKAMEVIPAHILVHQENSSPAPIDFSVAMRDVGLLEKAHSATPLLWALVAFLAFANVSMLIWRDTASVNRLEGLVQDQQPAVAAARTIAGRAQSDQALMMRSLALRSDHDAIAGLGAVGRALPEGAWLQHYVWDGSTVRLTGYKPPKTDVATALRRSGRFSEVRSMNDEVQASVPAGEPFDLTARIILR